jgi:hypothetical protein
VVDPQADPMRVIEMTDDGVAPGNPLQIAPGTHIIWMNSTSGLGLRIEVNGPFDPAAQDEESTRSFAFSENRAVSREVLRPGAAISLFFETPGSYSYVVSGFPEPTEGAIEVRGRQPSSTPSPTPSSSDSTARALQGW